MHPHQKYPSAYRGYAQYPESAVPQSPFDVAYGSSLLPRQLLVSSPFVQVASPLPSPGHPHFQYQRGGPHPQAFLMAPPPPKLSMPPENRKRGLKHQQLKHEDLETPLKGKFKSMSSSTSSLDESTFDANGFSRNVSSGTSQEEGIPHQHQIYATPANQSSSSSLYQLHTSQSQNQLHSGSFQLSKLPTRCIMLMCVDPESTLTTFLDSITFGPLESARLIENYPEEGTNSLCLTFLKMNTCLNFYNNLLTYFARFKRIINSPGLAISFVHCKKLIPFISYAINNDGATRNVYIGNLNALGKLVTREFLTSEFGKFGLIDKIDLIHRPVKKEEQEDSETTQTEEEEQQTEEMETFAFIHFTSIASAIKAVEQLSLNTFWQPCKIFYGTDRCSIQNDTLAKSLTDEGLSEEDDDTSSNRYFDQSFIREEDEEAMDTIQYFYPQHFPHSEEDIASALHQNSAAVMAVASNAGGAQNIGNRTICLANLDPKTKVEDICNVVRGGILQHIKHIPVKKVCFLTFIETASAAQFFANANINPMVLHGKRVKVGWGKHSGALPTNIALAVTVGASRNVYIGIKEEDLEDPKETLPDEDQLRHDFSQFGEIEQVNYFKQNRCVFLNFHSISSAMRVVEDANGVNAEELHEQLGGLYKNFKISFGKDRCGNPPKAKKKKNRKKKQQQHQQQYQHHGDAGENEFEDNIEAQNIEVEEVPVELFASMGITSKADDDDNITTEVNGNATDAFGITTTETSDAKIPDYLSISSSDTSEGEIIFTKPQPSFKPQRNVSDPVHREKSYQQKPRHRKNQSYTPSVGSRVSSHASLNSMYFREPEPQMYYKAMPFAPPAIPTHSQARMSPSYRTQFSTNGSQVMAQYLAQSQHANMVYAANVLNTADVDYFEDEYGNAYRRTARLPRR